MARLRIFRFPRRSRVDIADEVDQELAFHLDQRTEDLIRSGLDRAAAMQRARAEFGDLEYTRRYCQSLDRRTEQSLRLTDRVREWRHDLSQAWRTVYRNPGFTLVAVGTLALGIGANTAIFSVVRSVLLRPLPYTEPERLVVLGETDPSDLKASNPVSALNLLDYAAAQRSLTGLAGSDGRSVTWRPAQGDPQLLDALAVTPNIFGLLGVAPIQGRALSDAEDLAGGAPRTVLSYGLWQSAFAGNPSVIGQTMTLNDLPYRIVGVMPQGFSITGREAMWTPLTFARERANPEVSRRQHFLRVIGRVRQGVTIEAAELDLARISQDLAREYPDANGGRIARLTPLGTALTGQVGPSLLLLQLAGALVLLIACVNLANLSLARGTIRRREMALRAALGAGRLRLVLQLLVESLLLAGLGGALGTALALVATGSLLALEPQVLPPLFPVRPDPYVLLFGIGISLLTGVVFGLFPAFASARPDLRQALQDGGRGGTGGARSGVTRRVLVIAQVALAVVLLAGAGLLFRSFAELTQAPLGFDPDQIMTAEVRVSGERYDPPAVVNSFYDRLLDELRNTPGVTTVGATTKLPTGVMMRSSLVVESHPDNTATPDIGLVLVRGEYFSALRVPLLEGRLFGPQDNPAAPNVVLVNRSGARRYFPDGEVVGQRVRLGPDPSAAWATIIGVVGDVREEGIEREPGPVIYASHVQNTWWRSLTLVVRGTGDPGATERAIRRALRKTDPTLALRNVHTMESVLGSTLAARRLSLALVGSFAAVALLLAAVGLYGVLAFTVSSRRREFGVRMALGAERRSVLLLVLRQGIGWAGLGLVLGIATALGGSRLLRDRLYGIAADDGMTYTVTVVTLLAVAVLASLVPAVRAIRVDPAETLRSE